jgi:hypothetical protein
MKTPNLNHSHYDYVGNFSESLAPVKLNDKWGFIDKNGNEVIKIKYDLVLEFSEGLAVFKLKNKWGLVNKQGKEQF